MKTSTRPSSTEGNHWHLVLYVAGSSATSERARSNLETLTTNHLKGRCTVEVIDLVENPQLAEEAQIFALPTLVRLSPLPLRKIIGDLSDTEKVMLGLNLSSPGQRA